MYKSSSGTVITAAWQHNLININGLHRKGVCFLLLMEKAIFYLTCSWFYILYMCICSINSPPLICQAFLSPWCSLLFSKRLSSDILSKGIKILHTLFPLVWTWSVQPYVDLCTSGFPVLQLVRSALSLSIVYDSKSVLDVIILFIGRPV